jgi:hypothetical protein
VAGCSGEGLSCIYRPAALGPSRLQTAQQPLESLSHGFYLLQGEGFCGKTYNANPHARRSLAYPAPLKAGSKWPVSKYCISHSVIATW